MAELDVKILINKLEEFQLKKEKLQKIIDICDQEFSYSDYDFYSISNKAKLIIYAMDMELEEMKKHSICKHEKISIGIWKGNTHKKDFYEDVCNNCGKIINEYSI